MSHPLTPGERKTFAFITDPAASTGLIQVEFDGELTAAIASFAEDPATHEVTVFPLAVLVTPAMFPRLIPPDGAETI